MPAPFLNGLLVGATTLPASGVSGELRYRTDFRCWFQWDGSAWQQISVGTFSGSFPASPVTNLRVYRADYDRTCHYDGTRWLSERYPLPGAAYTTVQPVAAAATNKEIFLYPMPSTHDVLLKSWRCGMVYVLGTNNGSNYWTVTLRTESSGGVSSLASFTTSTYTGSTYTDGPLITSFSTNPVTRGAKTISIAVAPTGTPGSIYLTPYLEVCNIIT